MEAYKGTDQENSLPARWHEQSIVINDAVILGPPYTINDLKAGEGKERRGQANGMTAVRSPLG